MREVTYCQLPRCHRRMEQPSGRKPRRYCCHAHQMQAHRLIQREAQRNALRQRWTVLPQVTQSTLETLMQSYGTEAASLALDALKGCLSDLGTAIRLAQIFQLEIEESSRPTM